MAHEIEQLADGSAAFATARVPAWHRLGTVADQAMTASELLDLAHLGGWNVRKSIGAAAIVPGGKCEECGRAIGARHTRKCSVPAEMDHADDLAVTDEDTAGLVTVPGWYSTLRTVPVSGETQALGMVGADYTPVQNEELAEFLTAITDQSGAVFETGGSLRGGADVFMTLKLPESIMVGGSDPVDLYLAGFNSHTGRSRLQVVTTPVRVVCANTERAALRNTQSRYYFRHTPGITGRIQEAREALKITFDWRDAFQAEAESMINTELSRNTFEDLIKTVWPEKFAADVADWKKPQQEHFETVAGLFGNADTQENIRGTVWAGYQAIVEYLDWQVPVTGEVTEAQANDVRASRNFTGQYDSLKADAFKYCRDLVAAA